MPLARSSPLQSDRAFVVQFSNDAMFRENIVRGRVEHVRSGKVGHFVSLGQLLDFFDEVLSRVDEAGCQDEDD
jgi:hypothetical protein